MTNREASLPPAVRYLRTPEAIRHAAEALWQSAQEGKLAHLRWNPQGWPAVKDRVKDVIARHNPDPKATPLHSRWRHFAPDGVDRLAQLRAPLEEADARCRAELDLATVSVLLDAGAGPDWRYRTPGGGELVRSEGLAVASFDLFVAGVFSSNPKKPWQVDAEGLVQLSADVLAQGLQVDATNPLLGLEGRLHLLQELGRCLAAQPEFFGAEGRPGNLCDSFPKAVDAGELLTLVLDAWSGVFPSRLSWDGQWPLGDVWRYRGVSAPHGTDDHVPFHKLSQWLTYSLLEPLADSGREVSGVERLTGLAEYRNGGLFLDLGALELRDPALAATPLPPDHPAIIEWRALTLMLLDRLAADLRDEFGLSASEYPLVKLLQGGTWLAGREVAAKMRPDGSPPLTLASDGTVF